MKHKHEWIECLGQYDAAECAKCGMVIELEEILRRLNATECLSAEDAVQIYYNLHGADLKKYGPMLKEYAKTLRGE